MLLLIVPYFIFLGSIENMLLMQEKDFETPDGPRSPMDVTEFYDALETKRIARLDGLVQQYNSIESLLIKVLDVGDIFLENTLRVCRHLVWSSTGRRKPNLGRCSVQPCALKREYNLVARVACSSEVLQKQRTRSEWLGRS